jgi:uncharacterized protein YbaA (DUF1428 family)
MTGSAKQFRSQEKSTGLLRRFAPPNDGVDNFVLLFLIARKQQNERNADALCRWIYRCGAEEKPAGLHPHGEEGGKVWREHGATEYREWVAEDVKVGKRTSFPRSVKLKPGETVVFSWITYKSRAHRDRVNKKVMADPRLKDMMNLKTLPFDAKRMIYGGFESLVKA